MADEQTTEEEQAAQLFEITNKLKEASPAFFASATEAEIQQLIRAVKTGKERKWKHAESPRQGSDGLTPENYTGLSDLHPLPGIEYTFAASFNPETAPYAIYGEGMYPQSTLKIPGSEKTLEMSSDEFKTLSDAIDTFESNQNQETREKSERVRLVLEALQLWGQSLSASKSGEGRTKTGEPRKAYEDALFSVAKYGLWSRAENNTLHVGSFDKSGMMTVTAGDHWKGYAAVFPPEPGVVSVTAADKPRSFIPPAEMVYVVPTNEVRLALLSSLNASGGNFKSLPDDVFIGDLIFTHDDVISGKLTDFVTTHFVQETKKDPN